MQVIFYHLPLLIATASQKAALVSDAAAVSPSPLPPTPRAKCSNDSVLVKQLFEENDYNRQKIPVDEQGRTIEVRVQFWILQISQVSESTSDFDMEFYINEQWVDTALRYDHMNPCKANLSLSPDTLERIWTPNSCFIDSKDAYIHASPFKNAFLMIYPNGSVWVNYRVRAKGPCEMNLRKFPLDEQECGLIYESFSYNNQEVRMRWDPQESEPVYKVGTITLPEFDLVKIEPTLMPIMYPAGYWDELHLKLRFRRRFTWYLLQAYLPTYLTICVSWVSFMLGTKAIPARTTLGVSTLLAMVFQFGNIMRNLPRVSYIKAIDVWMLVCMTFIFASLIELACIGFIVREGGKLHRKETMHARKTQLAALASQQQLRGAAAVAGGIAMQSVPEDSLLPIGGRSPKPPTHFEGCSVRTTSTRTSWQQMQRPKNSAAAPIVTALTDPMPTAKKHAAQEANGRPLVAHTQLGHQTVAPRRSIPAVYWQERHQRHDHAQRTAQQQARHMAHMLHSHNHNGQHCCRVQADRQSMQSMHMQPDHRPRQTSLAPVRTRRGTRSVHR